MILKVRTKPPEIFFYESLLQRTSPTHQLFPQWTEKLRRVSAGYTGEQRVDSLLSDIPIAHPHYFIHDLFVQKSSSHQIDTILVTDRFVLLLEIKSIAGLLTFDPQTRQFYRTNKDGSIDGMYNPDDQIRRHEKFVESFLKQEGFKLPVVGAIIFTYTSSIIQSRAGDRIIMHSSGLPFLMDQLSDIHSVKLLSDKRTFLLAQKLKDLHSTKPMAPIDSKITLKTGVLCPFCAWSQMSYKHKKWRCDECSCMEPFAHLRTLLQYRVLVRPFIKSIEFRAFTGITSPSISSKLLVGTGMHYTGSYKDRTYLIPEFFEHLDSIS